MKNHTDEFNEENEEINPIDYLLEKMEMLESHLIHVNTYLAELSIVHNGGYETYETWTKRINKEMKNIKEDDEFDFSVKKNSGIIL